jgi:CMP/dCMP kinase
MVVAIDGPAGSGKTTTARAVAKELGFAHIDTGAMYRAVTLLALREQTALDDDDALTEVACRANIDLAPGEERSTVLLDGEDVSVEIRAPEIDFHVSRVSEVGGVREHIVAQQRLMGQRRDVVMEGRDIGTVVLPDADLKIFIVATVQERARRRHKELALLGISHELAEVVADLERRDEYDSTRAIAPLRPSPDAERLDTTSLTIGQQVSEVIAKVRAIEAERTQNEEGS